MEKRPSLKDIARKVGVSTALVSYVLNNKKEGSISKMIAEKIREAARELNYRTNQVARSLKTSRTMTIGLIVADISNPFSSSLARIIEDEAYQENYTVIFGSSDENEQKCARLIDTFLNRQVDGLILAAPEDAEPHVRMLLQQQVPLVLIDRYFPDIKTNYVALDNYNAAYAGVSYLLSKGRSKIGMINYDTSLVHLNERTRGYLEALEKNSGGAEKNWLKKVDLNDITDEITKGLDDMIRGANPVDALFFASNSIATVGLRYLNSLSLRVPSDLMVICFDETDTLGLFYAPLPYIRQPLREMGSQATRILIDCIQKNNKVTQVNLLAELVDNTF